MAWNQLQMLCILLCEEQEELIRQILKMLIHNIAYKDHDSDVDVHVCNIRTLIEVSVHFSLPWINQCGDTYMSGMIKDSEMKDSLSDSDSETV